jgi:hypothetical protein
VARVGETTGGFPDSALLKYSEDVRVGSEAGSDPGCIGGKLGIPQNKSRTRFKHFRHCNVALDVTCGMKVPILSNFP